jgi:uncharacterized protein (TIGR01777 family)
VRRGAFDRLNPGWEGARVIQGYDRLADGSRLVLAVSVGPFAPRWVAGHRILSEGREFQDVQEQGPFFHWVHTHRFTPCDDGGSRLEDEIEFVPPLGSVGRAFGVPYLRRRLQRAFTWRHARTRTDLARHEERAGEQRLRVAVSGAGGLVGSELTAFLTTGGHEVRRLVRQKPDPGRKDIFFDPVAGDIDAGKLEECDAVVHLAGENIAAGRWTEERKRRIRDSRVSGTRLIADALAAMNNPPRVLINASAIGYYGDRGDERLVEQSAPGHGFLPEVCQAWEAAVEPAERTGIRVVRLRIGVVLSSRGGALQRMLPPFRFGLGGPIGRGRRFTSWISLDDLVGAIHFLLFESGVSGAVNAVAPTPVRNAEFTRELARVLKKPAFVPVPPPALRLALGEMADELLLAGNRIYPSRLREAGFRFQYPDLESALRFELGLFDRAQPRPEFELQD